MPRHDAEREELLSTLQSKGIRNERVLRAIGSVERHKFVLPPFVNKAYEDTALPIASGQTISQPYTVAFMTEALEPVADMKVLEIGTGSGYQAAVLCELGARVFTVERHMELHLKSRKVLTSLGYRVASKCGDGTLGWTEFAPYDGIVVTAAAPEIPGPLVQQLADGGRLVIPVGGPEGQNIVVITKSGDNLIERVVEGFKFVPLIGKMGWTK